MQQCPNYREYLESGTDFRVAKRISMAYILHSIANEYEESALEDMARYDLVHKRLKATANNLMQSFEAFHGVMRQFISTEEARLQLCEDYQGFKQFCDKFMDMDEQARPESAPASEPRAKAERTHTEES